MYEEWRFAPCILGNGIIQKGVQLKEYNTLIEGNNLRIKQ